MIDSKFVCFPYTAQTLISELPNLLVRQWYWTFYDTSLESSIEELHQEIPHKVGEDPNVIMVFPYKGSGGIVWNQLNPRLAILAAPPQQNAMITVPTEMLMNNQDQSLWEFFVGHASKLSVYPSQEFIPPEAPATYPELAPRAESMPKWLRKRCAAISFENVQSPPDAIAVKAGLFQIHGDLHTSHEYAQDCQGEGKHVAGDYWHGIMHRREPDYGNSKYWFRRVGQHPIFGELAKQANSILEECASPNASEWQQRMTQNGWNSSAFVDLCEECANGRDQELTLAAKKIQWVEMMLLLQQTYVDAVG